MASDIRNIRYVVKRGAYGNPRAVATYVYGQRPDGRTVPCNRKKTPEGMQIWSSGTQSGERMIWRSDFSAEEWRQIQEAQNGAQASEATLTARGSK